MWRGMTRLTLGDRGDRRHQELNNCYVSPDGSEIRAFPGWKCVVDLVSGGRSSGFLRDVLDATRPAYVAAGNYRSLNTSGITEKQYVWAPVTNLHCFEMVRGQILLIGETLFRREPLLVSATPPGDLRVTSWNLVGGQTVLTLENSWNETPTDGAPEGQVNSLSPDGTASTYAVIPSRVYIEAGGTGTGPVNELCGLVHEVDTSNSGAMSIILTTVVTASGTFDTPVVISRVRPMQGATYPTTPDLGIDDPESLTSFRINEQIDVDAVITDCIPAYVANRMRDFGDSVGGVAEGASIGNLLVSRRRGLALPWRLVPDNAGDRLILAAPGYGCVFQVPALLPIVSNTPDYSTTFHGNDVFDRPRSLGIPKAVMFEDTSGSHAFHITTGAVGFVFPDGIYKVAVAYRDDTTGESGLASEEIELTLSGGTKGIRIAIMFPGYLMPETLALSIDLYRSKVGESLLYFQQSITNQTAVPVASIVGKYGVLPDTVGSLFPGYKWMVLYDIPFVADANLNTDVGIDPLRQMPMGAKAARTIRASSIFAGYRGNLGQRDELLRSKIAMRYDAATAAATNEDPNKDRLRCVLGDLVTAIPPYGAWGCAGGTLPPAYAGQRLASLLLFPYPVNMVQLDALGNIKSAHIAGVGDNLVGANKDPQWHLVQTPLREGSTWEQYDPPPYSWLLMPHGKYQVSLVGDPSATPSTQTLPVDAEKEQDVEGIGRIKGDAILATRSTAYFLTWQQDPANNAAQIVADDHGTIAANSMQECDLGCVSISEKGPVVFTPAADWIGVDIHTDFVGESAKYLRDSDGMMRHSWSCHDPERSLVYFGVFSNRLATHITFRGVSYSWEEAPDEAKSRFPCDEVLIYNYRSRSWSVWLPPAGMEVMWMARIIDAAGQPRICFLAADQRIYALDDTWGEWNRDPLKCILTGFDTLLSEATTSTTFDSGSTGIANGNYIAIGMQVLFTDSTGKVYKGYGTVSSFDVMAGTFVTVPDAPVTCIAGDVAWLGVRRCSLKTNHITLSAMGKQVLVNGLALRYSLWSRLSDGNIYSPAAPVFVRVKDRIPRRFDSVDSDPSAVTVPMTTDTVTTDFDYLGHSEMSTLMRDRVIKRGVATSQEHEIELDFICASQIRLHDATLEGQ
jgi:hypothetical protein